MHRAAAFLFLASLAFAQHAQSDDIAAAAKSPALLAQFVQTHKVLDWEALRRALGTREPEYYSPCGKSDDDPCLTKLVSIRNPDQQILILRRGLAQGHIVYLRYVHAANGDWRFAGERGAFERNGCSCGHAIARLFGKPFLKITSDRTQVGFALAQEVEDWFDLTQPGFEPAFSYSTYFNLQPFSLAVGRTAKAQVVPRVVNGVATIDLVLRTHFEGPGFDMAVTFVGIFERPAGERASACAAPIRDWIATR